MELAPVGIFWFYLGVFQRTIGPSYTPQFYELLGGETSNMFFMFTPIWGNDPI